MSESEISTKLTEVFRDVFDEGTLVIGPQTTARDVDGWNSLANIRLMIAVEEAFRIKFDVGEFQEYRNVGELLRGIALKAG